MYVSQIENWIHIMYRVQMEAEGNNGFPAQARAPGAREAADRSPCMVQSCRAAIAECRA